MRSAVARVSLVVLGTYLLALTYLEWRWLQTGYDMKIGFIDPGLAAPPSVVHVSFPLWRQSAACGIATLILSGIVLGLWRRLPAVVLIGFALALTVLTGVWDVLEYGTLHSPTTAKVVVTTVLTFASAFYLHRTSTQ